MFSTEPSRNDAGSSAAPATNTDQPPATHDRQSPATTDTRVARTTASWSAADDAAPPSYGVARGNPDGAGLNSIWRQHVSDAAIGQNFEKKSESAVKFEFPETTAITRTL